MKIAVLVPCYNEEAAIAKVVRDFRAALPAATIYVYDNNSKDGTVAQARRPARSCAPKRARARAMSCAACSPTSRPTSMCWSTATTPMTPAQRRRWSRKLIEEGLDIVSGRRVATGADAYRAGHVLGNRMLTGLTAMMFGVKLQDMLSGYRIMSRRFVKSFPFTAEGFDIETELTVHAVRLLMPMAEVETPLQGASGRVGQQAQHLSRRLSDPVHDRAAGARGAAADVLRHHLRACWPLASAGLGTPVVSGISPAPAWCRACRRRCSRPA